MQVTAYNLNHMSLQVSSSQFRTQDSFFSIELASVSNQFTPIMELDGHSASSSSLEPKVLQFAQQIQRQGPNQDKKSIELFIGSRIYESFQVQPDSPSDEGLQIRDFQEHCLRSEQLFPPSIEEAVSQEMPLEQSYGKLRQKRARKDSVTYFEDQLAELKKNISKLLNIMNGNPEQDKLTPPSRVEHRHSVQPRPKGSFEAKSTQSQQLKDQSNHIELIISQFHSPAKQQDEGLQDVSPIQPRDFSLGSNVSELSTRSLMRRKMKNSGQLCSNSA